MGSNGLPDIPFTSLALEPIEGESTAPKTGRARFNPNTRDGSDRRNGVDRREKVRYQGERRKGDRRPAKRGWDYSSL